jgi:hypothetical protein
MTMAAKSGIPSIWVFDYLREPDGWQKCIEEGARLGSRTRPGFLTEWLVLVSSGIALIRKGEVTEGTALRERGPAIWEEGGGRATSPYMKSVLAEGTAQAGDLAEALDLIDEVIARASLLCGSAPHQRPAAFVEGRSGSWGAQLPRLARLGAAATGEVLGTAHCDQLAAR